MDMQHGPLESATRKAISEMSAEDGINRPLAELAIILAAKLDSGNSGTTGMATSANSKELRETLKQMMEVSKRDSAIDGLTKLLSEPDSS